jgi:chromate transporter
MKNKLKFYMKLFKSTFYISAFTFGGGYVIIPLMRKKFVNEFHWIEEKEMLDLVAIAQSSPGAIAVNAAILVGYRVAGVLGAVITILGTVLPPFFILSMISVAYTQFIENIFVKYLLRGMQAGVAAVIIDVSISMILPLLKEKKLFPIIVLISAWIASFIFDISAIIIILVCAVMGAISVYYDKSKKAGGDLL